jgi:putative endonuclease
MLVRGDARRAGHGPCLSRQAVGATVAEGSRTAHPANASASTNISLRFPQVGHNHCEMPYHVYILANRRHGTLYVGVTNDLARRVFEHRQRNVDGFTKRHKVNRLVYYEEYPTILEAIAQEKRVKRWQRAWKIKIVDSFNPDWVDLYKNLNV